MNRNVELNLAIRLHTAVSTFYTPKTKKIGLFEYNSKGKLYATFFNIKSSVIRNLKVRQKIFYAYSFKLNSYYSLLTYTFSQ